MNAVVKRTLCVGAMLGAVLFCARPAVAQVTTGNIVGTVPDPQGGVLPGAVVVATHIPTGSAYQAVTQKDGRFQILEVRVGGPYTVAVTVPAFKPSTRKDIMVKLGEEAEVNFKLELASQSTTVEVKGTVPPIDFSQPGVGANISNAQKETIPTIARSIFDVIQTNPNFGAYTMNGNGQTSISVAGSNSRYNNMLIDGSVDNDIFGLSSTGTPEGQTSSQPISLDAVQEFQLLVSPYDVRQGGFAGGGVNIITKSGTNDFHGDGFFYGRNQSWVGKYYNPNLLTTVSGVSTLTPGIVPAIATFSDKQGGGSIGGPLRQNKIFFFASTDSQRQQTPSGICVDCATTTFNGSKAAVEAIISTLKTQYGYNPSGTSGIDPEGNFIKLTNSDKMFGRVDFNLAKGQQLTIRHNYVNALADVGFPTNTVYLLPDAYYRIAIKTHSTVGQLNSTIGKSAVNELRIAGTTVRNNRGAEPFEQNPFPNTTVTIQSGVTVKTGREASSTANSLDQNVIEINDDLTMVHGKHTFTVGTHDEFFKFTNLFVQNAFGTYAFTSAASNGLANFQNGVAQSYSYFFPTPGVVSAGIVNGAAQFSVRQYGAYAGDQWRPTARLTVTGGVRLDMPRFVGVPSANPITVTDFNLRTDIVPTPVQWSPRVGLGWDPTGKGRQQVRMGIGIFSGRTPYVWMSNQFGNTGVDFTQVSISINNNNLIPYIVPPGAQSATPTGGTVGTTKANIDLLNPNYKFPSQLRGNLSYDSNLPWGLVGSGELLWSKTLDDIQYQDVNIKTTGITNALDGRPLFTPAVSTLGAVILLTNTNQGHFWSMTYDVKRPFKNGWFFDVGYLYGQAKTIEESESSVASTSFFAVYAPNPNSPPMTTSDFDPGHRVTTTVSYAIPVFHGYTVTMSGFYSGQSGHPYTLSYSADTNGDGNGFNDNMYMVPSTAVTSTGAPLTYKNGTYANLLSFFQSLGTCATDQIGKIYVRNSCRAPWVNTLNGRINVGLPFKKVKAEITLDALNVLNLLNSNWGLVKYANFNQIDVVAPTFTGGSLAAGTQTGLDLTTITKAGFTPFTIDDVRSRWQLQLGARISF